MCSTPEFVFSALAPLALASLASAQLVVGVQTSSANSAVWRIDVTTGERAVLFGGSSSALAVDDASGLIYSADFSVLSRWSYGSGPAATTLGVVHTSSGAPLPLVGLACGGGRLFGTARGTQWLYEIDPVSLLATNVPMPQVLGWVEGLSFDPSSGLFYAQNDQGPSILYSVDVLGSGAIQLVSGLQAAGAPDSGVIGDGGLYYITSDDGGPIHAYDLTSGTFVPSVFWCPYGPGNDECGSAWAPSLAPPTRTHVYCAPSASSGCEIRVLYSGTPSASAGSGFLLTLESIRGGSRVQPHYSLSGPSQAPFLSGVRCIRPPVFRMPPAQLGGTFCTQVYSFDFNTLVAGTTNPALTAGQTIWLQAAAQSAALAASGQYDLSPGVVFTIGP